MVGQDDDAQSGGVRGDKQVIVGTKNNKQTKSSPSVIIGNLPDPT